MIRTSAFYYSVFRMVSLQDRFSRGFIATRNLKASKQNTKSKIAASGPIILRAKDNISQVLYL